MHRVHRRDIDSGRSRMVQTLSTRSSDITNVRFSARNLLMVAAREQGEGVDAHTQG